MNEVTLPWMPKQLSPNARLHWTVTSPIKKTYRATCFNLTKQSGLKAPETQGKIHLYIDFYPPDKRHRDDDNMIASFKSGRDGVADALGVNDRRFKCVPRVMDEIGGMVKVRITTGAAEA